MIVRRHGSFVARAALVATGTFLVLRLAVTLDPLGAGLAARVAIELGGTSSVVRTATEIPGAPAALDAWRDIPASAFRLTWQGGLAILQSGTYVLATRSAGHVDVYVDGRAVLAGAAGPSGLAQTPPLTLTRGVHDLVVAYTPGARPFQCALLWAAGGGPLTPIPAGRFTPRPASLARWRVSDILRRTLAATEWIWVGVLVSTCGALAWRWFAAGASAIARAGAWTALRGVLIGSGVISVLGLWWGLPRNDWAPDELTPDVIIGALARHFSHGWFDRYPPFHFYVLTAAYSPLLLLHALGRVSLQSPIVSLLMVVIGRLVGVVAGLGTVFAAYCAGARAFRPRAGVFAAAIAALAVPFVYYAKTANVDAPYLCWFAMSLVWYLRVLDTLDARAFGLLALTAACTVATKDQAYALYLPMPAVIVHRLWRAHRNTGALHPVWRALTDARLFGALASAAIAFVCFDNVLFNFGGFIGHIRFLMGDASQGYRMFDATLAGQIALLRLTGRLLVRAWGWPLLVVSLVGVVAACRSSTWRPNAIALLVLPASYYVTFIAVILYNYDRFVMPMTLVLALFGGLALDRFLSSASGRRWRAALVGAVFAYTLLYAGSIDVLMLTDSRYTVERWMAAHVGRDDLVASCFDTTYLPDLEDWRHARVCTTDDLDRARPAYFVLNADYARAVPPESPPGRFFAALESNALGYRRVLQFRHAAPWRWLPGAHPDLVGARGESTVVSTLRDINPTIEIYVCADCR